jgi:hypothetical protein
MEIHAMSANSLATMLHLQRQSTIAISKQRTYHRTSSACNTISEDI